MREKGKGYILGEEIYSLMGEKMKKEEICFIGLLANVDSSIMKVRLKHDFQIENKISKEIIDLISKLEGRESWEIKEKFSSDYHCLNYSENRIYFIHKALTFDLDKTKRESLRNTYKKIDVLDHDFVRKYLEQIISLMRLFKEGNIDLPLRYYYYFDDGTPKSIGRFFSRRYTASIPKYKLDDSEISELEKFIEETKFPFSKSFLQLAFDNFNLSYYTHNMNLAFLTLMSSMEALFNRGQSELGYTISRCTAILLGKNKEDSDKIYHDMKKLYDKRSETIHGRRSNTIDLFDVDRLLYYVRESIKEIYSIGKNKEDIFNLLNSCGFGERLWKKK